MWQPIETAPKDGTDILVVNEWHIVRIAFWDTARDGIWSVWPGRERIYPTLWQPVPAPPSDEPMTAEKAEDLTRRAT